MTLKVKKNKEKDPFWTKFDPEKDEEAGLTKLTISPSQEYQSPGTDVDFKECSPREVYVYGMILEISQVDLMKHEFDATIQMKCTWLEDTQAETESFKTFDFEKWDEDVLWNPQIRFNMKDDGKVMNQKVQQSFFRYGIGEDEKVLPAIEYIFTLKGTFRDQFSLHSFPFDMNDLKIRVYSTLPANHVVFHEDKYDNTKVCIRSDVINSNNIYTFYGPICHTNDKAYTHFEGHDTTFSIHHITVYCTRKPGFFIFNVYLPLSSLTALTFASFQFPPSEFNDRFSISLNITLVLVAYKFLLVRKLPSLPYNTNVDLFVLVLFYLSLSVLIHHMIMVRVCCEDHKRIFRDQHCPADMVGMIFLLSVFLCLLIYTLIISIASMILNRMFLDEQLDGENVVGSKCWKSLGNKYTEEISKHRPKPITITVLVKRILCTVCSRLRQENTKKS